ncbi:MAG: polysaccharide biosynthesis tyrosine autokinase [Thermodesulfobacteriota bacterium]|nr:polysaccharide biosynthesis tyrosine autokinase [Thermodesulfobacteriota bacterium]
MTNEYSQEQEQIDLRDYLRVILKRRWTIIAVFAIIVMTVAIHTFTATPIYKATTRLVIEKENPNVVSIEEVMAVDSSGTDYYQTQYKIIESRTVAREVIKRLHLEDSEEFFPKPKDDFISNLKQSIRETIQYWKDSIESLLKTDTDETPESTGEYNPDSALVSGFIGRIEVSPIRNSRLLDLSFEAKNPVLATRITNSLARAYIDQNLEIKLKAVQDAVKWLHQRIEVERKKVETAEQALLKYKEKHGIITDFTSDTEHVTAQKLAKLNAQVVDAESIRVEAETRYEQALSLKGSPDMLGSIPEVLANELIREIKKMEVELYKRMSELSKKYGKQHPQMVGIESELKTLEKRKSKEIMRVINSLRNQYQVALAKENSLKASFAKQKQESLDLNQKAIEYSVLNREVESARDMYDLLIKRFKETTLTEDMRTGNIRVIDMAEVPRFPVKPKKKLNLLLAIIVGLVMGTGLAFFFEYLDNTIKTPDDVKQYLKIPYLGPVPLMDLEEEANPGHDIPPGLVSFHSPKSTASEAYRGIRTNILLSSADSAPQVILTTSSGPREGKTITTVNLAITMAQSGSRVVVVDADMRRPKIHRMFGIKRDIGLSNLLVGNSDEKGAIIHSKISNLDIIPCGPIPPNPAELLVSKRMTGLIDALRGRYDRVLIDSPPVTAVTDATIMSRIADGVILAVRAGDFPREMLQNGLSQLQNVGAHILGAVLNGVDIGKDKYYYYYYQYYYYYYGDDGEKKKKKRGKKRKRSRSKGSYYGEEDQ